jgi:hypothetical protein
MTHPFQTAPKTFFFLLISLTLLTACGTRRQTPTAMPPTIPPATATPTASRTPTPLPSLTPTQTLEPGVEPTNTPVPVTTPVGSAEDYRLKTWDYSTALRIYADADNVPIAEEYADLRQFYQLSLLEELYLAFPELRSDPGLLRDMANLKGLGDTYWATYGLLHNRSVEAVRQGLEDALNNGSTNLPELTIWGETIFVDNEYRLAMKTTRLFDSTTPANVVRITIPGGWDVFVLRENQDGTYTVIALYSEWKEYDGNDETIQITDLNGNGRDEIAITAKPEWVCEEYFFLYEWDGQEFTDLINTQVNFFANTADDDKCPGITFQPDTAGRKLISAGTFWITPCEDYPYLERMTYRWNGKGFVPLASSEPVPPGPRKPDKCTIGWALAAGSKNDSAVKLLLAAVENWPADADEVWGPAAHDYFKIKLAAWDMSRGQVQRGLELLEQVVDAPAAPEFPLASQIAATFLDTYETRGFYQAVLAVQLLYEKEQESKCGTTGCSYEDMWGFDEAESNYYYNGSIGENFQSIDAMSLDLNRMPLENLSAFQNWFQKNGLSTVWIGEGDADRLGQLDWLVDLSHPTYVNFRELYIFLRLNGQLTKVLITGFYSVTECENKPHRWESFRPDPNAPVINVYQSGTEFYVFHLTHENGTYQAVIDLDSSDLSPYDKLDRIEVKDWSIDDGMLTVQYDGIQGVYVWDKAAGKLVPTGYAPDLQEENISRAERALYFDDDPAMAVDILSHLLSARIVENFLWDNGAGITIPPRVRPYTEYLLGLAYERAGDPQNAARAYWQLWHDFPACPYSLAAQSKLEKVSP